MTDDLSILLQDLAEDVPDEGFSQAVMGRIERPRIVRRVLSGVMFFLTAWLVFGPVAELVLQAGARISQSLRGADPIWFVQNQPAVLVVLVVIAFVPLMSFLEE